MRKETYNSAERQFIDLFSSKFKQLKRDCKTVDEVIQVSNRIENTFIKLKDLKRNNELSNTKYKLHLSVWQKIQKELFLILPVLLSNLDRIDKIDSNTYRYKARFHITLENISSIKGYELLQKLGFYCRETNANGVVKDHRFSIKAGKLLDLPPELLGNINNCEFLTNIDNLRKKEKCSISLEELKSFGPLRVTAQLL